MTKPKDEGWCVFAVTANRNYVLVEAHESLDTMMRLFCDMRLALVGRSPALNVLLAAVGARGAQSLGVGTYEREANDAFKMLPLIVSTAEGDSRAA